MMNQPTLPLSWRIRRGFWNRLAVVKFRGNKPVDIPLPSDPGRAVTAVPMAEVYSGIPVRAIPVGDHVPEDESSAFKRGFIRAQIGLYSVFPPMQAGLPPISEDPQRALDEAYTAAHRALFPAPLVPDEYAGEDRPDLGELALESPFACYLQNTPEQGLHWDLSHLGGYAHHPGLQNLGSTVFFEHVAAERRVRAVRIDCALGSVTPEDPAWRAAVRLALCAANNDITLVRHQNWVHLAAGSALGIATRNHFPKDHPLKRLLWPHMFGTQYSNEVSTMAQMVRGGDFETVFSFRYEGLCRLMEETFQDYRITVLDPRLDWAQRGLDAFPLASPVQDNLVELFDVLHAHARRYVETYYTSDVEIGSDPAVRDWLKELDALTPNGIAGITQGDATREAISRLIGAFIYMAAVQHEALGTGLWNYQMWLHKAPVRVYLDGRREPRDVYQRLVNMNFILNVHRKQLLDDFSYLALDERGAELFRQFRRELQELQRKLEPEPFAAWRTYPNVLEANINA